MASKWAKIVANLPRFLGTEPDYQTKVDALKNAILLEEPRHASHFAQQYANIRREKKQAEEIVKEINLRLEAYTQLLVSQYEVEDTTSLTLGNGDKVRTQPEPYLVVRNKDEFRKWCVENGFEESLALPWQTANSELKERLLRGESEMPGTEAHCRHKVVFSSGADEEE